MMKTFRSTNRFEYYEKMKEKIRQEAKTPQEYERRIKALADKLKI